MVRTVIVDDEMDSLKGLQLLLNACCPDVEIVGKAQTLPKAKAVIEAQVL